MTGGSQKLLHIKKVQHEHQKSTWGTIRLTSRLWIGVQKGRNVATFATPPPELALLQKAIEQSLQSASQGNSRVELNKGRQGGPWLWKPQGGFTHARAPHLTCQQQSGAWFCRLFPSQKMYKIPGILFAPFNIQEQNTINSTGQIVPSMQLTHDQSYKWLVLGTFINSRTLKDELLPCIYGGGNTDW